MFSQPPLHNPPYLQSQRQPRTHLQPPRRRALSAAGRHPLLVLYFGNIIHPYLKVPDTWYWKWGKWFWGRIIIRDFADISRTFPSDPRLFSPENEEISSPPTCWLRTPLLGQRDLRNLHFQNILSLYGKDFLDILGGNQLHFIFGVVFGPDPPMSM